MSEDLIKRLEQATSNDWDLDRSLFEAVHFPTEYFGSKVESWSRGSLGHGYTINTADGIRHLDAINSPNYTGSFDAARALIPTGLYWIASEGRTHPDEFLGAVQIFMPGEDKPVAEAEHESVIIATCIAALKAIAVLRVRAAQPAR